MPSAFCWTLSYKDKRERGASTNLGLIWGSLINHKLRGSTLDT